MKYAEKVQYKPRNRLLLLNGGCNAGGGVCTIMSVLGETPLQANIYTTMSILSYILHDQCTSASFGPIWPQISGNIVTLASDIR